MTLKSAACAPDNVTGLTVNEAVPRFWMVKVRVTVPLGKSALPKSVWSAPLGVVSPSMIVVPLPRTLISGPAGPRPTEGESTEPGITSLGAEVDSPGLAQPTARLSPPPPSFCNAST